MIKQFQGSLIGLAVGDAIGTTVEFKKPGTFEPMKDMIGGDAFRLPRGAWTDDTSMPLCLAESLIELKAFDLKDQMERYVKWFGSVPAISVPPENVLILETQPHQHFAASNEQVNH
jgi:ADP-ribosyl-[dinitrogen reductase] hydrolase